MCIVRIFVPYGISEKIPRVVQLVSYLVRELTLRKCVLSPSSSNPLIYMVINKQLAAL